MDPNTIARVASRAEAASTLIEMRAALIDVTLLLAQLAGEVADLRGKRDQPNAARAILRFQDAHKHKTRTPGV